MPRTAEDLNHAIRDLIDVVRTADLDGADLDEAVRAITTVADELRPRRHDGIRMQAGLKDPLGPRRMDDPNEFFPYSPVVGALNPLSPPVRMWRSDGDAGPEVHGEMSLGAAYNGPPDCVHGGVIAEVLDELLGSTCVVNEVGGFTGTLTIVYRSPTPLGRALRLRGWLDRSEGRKVFAKGTIHDGETLCAQAEGIFIQSEMLTPGGG